MNEDKEKWLEVRVGILEDTVSDLLTHLRENSNTAQDYVNYNHILQEAMQQANKAEVIYKTDKSYVEE